MLSFSRIVLKELFTFPLATLIGTKILSGNSFIKFSSEIIFYFLIPNIFFQFAFYFF